MLTWHHIGPVGASPPTILRYGVMEVARLHERVGGAWFATLRMHRPYKERMNRDCTSYEAGKAGCEEWARRHLAEFAEELERSRLVMAERQHWLGNG